MVEAWSDLVGLYPQSCPLSLHLSYLDTSHRSCNGFQWIVSLHFLFSVVIFVIFFNLGFSFIFIWRFAFYCYWTWYFPCSLSVLLDFTSNGLFHFLPRCLCFQFLEIFIYATRARCALILLSWAEHLPEFFYSDLFLTSNLPFANQYSSLLCHYKLLAWLLLRDNVHCSYLSECNLFSFFSSNWDI